MCFFRKIEWIPDVDSCSWNEIWYKLVNGKRVYHWEKNGGRTPVAERPGSEKDANNNTEEN